MKTLPTKEQKRPKIGVGGLQFSPRAKELVMEVLDSDRLTAGPKMTRFEAEIAGIHGCRYGLMCNSGTSALQIALAALKERDGWQDGDEVLVPALTFIASSNVVLYNGLRPVFVDVDPQYYTMDPSKIEERISSRTRAIMPVHIGGLPCDMDPILEVARAHRLRVVEDSCEAMFSRYRERPVGSFSAIACFSTYVAHLITTGVGGICTTNDPELMVMLKSIMNHGRDSIYIRIDDDAEAQGRELLRIADGRFSFVRLGHSFRCTELEAALGLEQLEQREALWARRQTIAARFTAAFARVEDWLQLPRARPESEHGYMFYPLSIIDSRVDRDNLVGYLEDCGIETRYLLPLLSQPVYRRLFGDLEPQFPVAAGLSRTAFYIGCHPYMSDADVDYVIDCLLTYFGRRP